MTRKVGERVRIRPKEWIDAQEKTSMGNIPHPEGNIFVIPMFEYAGRTAHITKEDGVLYYLDIDNGEWSWEDWMFDPGYNPADEPLSAEDAIRAMLDGETLYDKAGQKYFFELDPGERHYEEFVCLNRDGEAEKNHTFTGLCRRQEKRTRDMTKAEAEAWAKSDESLGWMVRIRKAGWSFPRDIEYTCPIDEYQRARLLPDLSGIDESTVQGFEVEE